jgi:hypothetical protein
MVQAVLVLLQLHALCRSRSGMQQHGLLLLVVALLHRSMALCWSWLSWQGAVRPPDTVGSPWHWLLHPGLQDQAACCGRRVLLLLLLLAPAAVLLHAGGASPRCKVL